ncbi:Uncharacterised protein [Bordetella pertussis]|nr:Uncharacterised protein [Bordetella pertussis]
MASTQACSDTGASPPSSRGCCGSAHSASSNR